MKFLTAPHLLACWIVLLYGAFIVWYGGRGTPMSAAEVDARLAAVTASTGGTPQGVGQARGEVVAELRRLMANDDGNEFYMLNLIRYRMHAQYPAGSGYDDNALAADARYSRALLPYLFKYGGIPVFLGTPQGRFIDQAGDVEWMKVAIVRYRSRRDMLRMVADVAPLELAVHKWASIEKTQVFPMRENFSLVLVRVLAALILAGVGAGLHALLSYTDWYQPPPAHAMTAPSVPGGRQ